MGRLELLVADRQPKDLLTGEPETETLTIECIRLGVDARVVKGRVTRRLYRLHLKRQPTAVARRVGQELRVVACAAERGDVFSVLVACGWRWSSYRNSSTTPAEAGS